ncbi:MAG: TonB-dependent receptor [Gammaproteobacteria bacterium]
MSNNALLRLSISAALATGLAIPAATSFGQGLEEVTVTAQRREEGVQDIPVAVSAFSAETLRNTGITEALDIAKIVPNFVAHNNTGLGTANLYSIRGLNNTESIATFDPPVGTYVNDFFIQRQNANNYAFFDINRVEVLRGPQGTLFGRNTTGGAVRMILNDPAAEFGGYAEAGAGRFGRTHFRASVDNPFSDTFRTKLSAYYIEDNGFVSNTTTGENGLNSEDNFGVRAHAQWDVADNIVWDGTYTFVKTDHANTFNFANDDGNRFTATGLVEDGAPLSGLVTGDKQNLPMGNETESMHLTTDLKIDLASGAQLELLASYLTLEQDFLLDFFDGPFNTGGFTIANDGEHDQITLEAKLSGSFYNDRINYTAGVFYFNEDNETDLAQIFNLGAIGLAPPPVGLPLFQYDRTLDNGVSSWAVYAQGDWALNDKTTLTLGLRYTDEEKDFGIRDNGLASAGAVINNSDLTAAGVPLEQSESIVTPRVALEYQFSDDIMGYASATRGFKSGGWNARGTAAINLQPFTSERVWSYEGGLRSEFMDSRLRVNATIFRTDVTDFQLPSAFEDPDSGAITFITQNFADMDINGAELEILALPVDRLTLFANIGFMDAEYSNLNPAIITQQAECRSAGTRCLQGIVNADGDISEPQRTPDTQISVGGWYEFQLSDTTTFTPQITAVRYGEHNVSTSGDVAAQVDNYTVVNAGFTIANDENNWSINASCKNCADSDQLVSFLAGFVYLQDPMTYSVTFNKGF